MSRPRSIITTNDLVIREFVEDDWHDAQSYATDPEVVKFEPWGPNTDQQTRQFIARCIRASAERPRRSYEFAVDHRESTALIGACGIRIHDDGLEGDIGFTLARAHWGRGFATQLARALIAFGFGDLELHRISATCDVDNIASARVLEKAGMMREGRLRKNSLRQGVWRDSYLYAIIVEE